MKVLELHGTVGANAQWTKSELKTRMEHIFVFDIVPYMSYEDKQASKRFRRSLFNFKFAQMVCNILILSCIPYLLYR